MTNVSGSKLSAAESSAVADRLTDLLNECSPRAAESPQVLHCGDVCVDSSDAAEDCTLLKVKADPRNNGQLLEVASTLSGLGITIREAEMEQHEGAGLWVFRILSANGSKLAYPEASSLLFLLGGSIKDKSSSRLQTSMPM